MSNINDAGQVLTGARKHLWVGFKKWADSDFMSPDADFVKSKIIPAFKVSKMQAEGVSEVVICAILVANNIIPRKPAQSLKRTSWNKRVGSLMRFIQDLRESGEVCEDVIYLRALQVSTFDGFADKLKTAIAIGLPNAEHLRSGVVAGGYTHPEKQTPCFAVFCPNGKFKQNVDTFGEGLALLKTMCFAVEPISKSSVKRKKYAFKVFKSRETNELYIGWKSRSGYTIKVIRNLPSVRAGYEMIDNEDAALVDAFEKMRPANEYWGLQLLSRVGPNWIDCEFVSPEMLLETFALRGVQYGNYVTQKERAELNLHAFNGMKDLANVLKLPDSMIGFNGDLGLAFGARGKGGGRFAAHFEPLAFNVNLTRNGGIGNFAHEFGHALSSYLYALGNTGTLCHFKVSGDISCNRDMDYFPKNLKRAVGALNEAIRFTQVRQRAAHLDAFRSKAYWATLPEVFARCFERWVAYELQTQGRSNCWLVSLNKSIEDKYDHYPYPTQKELDDGLADAFRELFRVIVAESKKGLFFEKGEPLSV